jgi:protein-tyrosine phosphatase
MMDTLDPFRLYQVDTDGHLFISGEVTDWQPLAEAGITAVIDLDCKLDIGTPEVPNSVVYIFWPIDDRPELPDVPLLGAIASLGAFLLNQGHKVLCQCGMGQNRSALVAGMILAQRGLTGTQAVDLICRQREGALYNRVFRSYLLSLGADAGCNG